MAIDKPDVVEQTFVIGLRREYPFYMARESIATGDEGNVMRNGIEYPMGKTAIDDGIIGPYDIEGGCDQIFKQEAFTNYTYPAFWNDPDPEWYGEIYWTLQESGDSAWETPATFEQGAYLYARPGAWRYVQATKVKIICTPNQIWFRVRDEVGDNCIGLEGEKYGAKLITSGEEYEIRAGCEMQSLSFETVNTTITDILFTIPWSG